MLHSLIGGHRILHIGTFITADMAARELAKQVSKPNPEEMEDGAQGVSIDAIIDFLRSKRKSMVQHESQYVFCHKATTELCRMMLEDASLESQVDEVVGNDNASL